jgi:hypothetical protein
MRTYKQGTKAPDSYVATLLTGVSGLDMTTISAAVGKIQAPNGVESSWTMTLSGATTSQVTVTYAFSWNITISYPRNIPDSLFAHCSRW